MDIPDLFGRGQDRPPAPEVASAADVEQYTMKWLENNPVEDTGPTGGDEATMDLPFAKQHFESDRRLEQKAEFPWLYDPQRGVRWDFDPIKLRNLAQANTWVGMLVQSITKEIAETPWTIVVDEDRAETRKRLQTHPEKREPIAKTDGEEFADRNAERIHDLLMDPNPDEGWHDSVEMWMADLLEVGSVAAIKYFPESQYTDGEHGPRLTVEPDRTEPRAIQTSAPEVWTKDYTERSGLLDGFWQFEHEKAPGSGNSEGGSAGTWGYRTPVKFDKSEVMWDDMSPRSNRRYGMPPTLLIEDFLRSLDLAVKQEQQYLSRGSIPSGAWIFEEYDREKLQEMKEEQMANVKGKPHKSLAFAGRGGDVRFEPMSMNFQELEFTERMQWYARVVSSVFQVPTAVVGIEPENINYHTFQGERENFEENTLGPYLQKLERFINSELIRPHWGSAYHFEFKPGVSETTRQAISERVRSEWNANLVQRSTALQELGRDLPDDAEDGYKHEVVDEPADEGGPFGDLELSASAARALSKDDGDGFAADVFRIVADGEHEMFDAGTVLGIGVDFPNSDVYVDWNVDEWPDEDQLTDAHVSIYGSIEDAQQVAQGVIEPMDSLDAAGQTEVAASVVKSVVEADSGNANLRKDEPLRETDDWYQFDVQPHMVEGLQAAIADDVDDLFERVLADAEIQAEIERLATDETEKSITSLARRLKDVLSQTQIAGDVADAIRDHSAEAVRETLEETITEADPDDPAAQVDVDAVTSQLAERDVAFADRFADDMAEDIRETVGEGYAEGKNSFEIQEDIAELGDIKEGWGGAERIARQELQVATGEARSAVADDLGKVEVWSDSGDDRVRDAHQDMDGTWKTPGESWEVDYSDEGRGLQKESVPGDSEPGIGCRCVTLLRDREDVDPEDYAGDAGVV